MYHVISIVFYGITFKTTVSRLKRHVFWGTHRSRPIAYPGRSECDHPAEAADEIPATPTAAQGSSGSAELGSTAYFCFEKAKLREMNGGEKDGWFIMV